VERLRTVRSLLLPRGHATPELKAERARRGSIKPKPWTCPRALCVRTLDASVTQLFFWRNAERFRMPWRAATFLIDIVGLIAGAGVIAWHFYGGLPSGWRHRKFWTRSPMTMSFAVKDGVPSMRFETHDSASMLFRHENEKSLPRMQTASSPVWLLRAAYAKLLRSAFTAGPQTTCHCS
jgi:hypothetical protein